VYAITRTRGRTHICEHIYAHVAPHACAENYEEEWLFDLTEEQLLEMADSAPSQVTAGGSRPQSQSWKKCRAL